MLREAFHRRAMAREEADQDRRKAVGAIHSRVATSKDGLVNRGMKGIRVRECEVNNYANADFFLISQLNLHHCCLLSNLILEFCFRACLFAGLTDESVLSILSPSISVIIRRSLLCS